MPSFERPAAPTGRTPYERELDRRTLASVLWVTLAVTVGILLIELILLHKVLPESALVALAASCLLALWLNARGAYFPASVLQSLTVLVATTVILIHGYGLRDSGIVTLPIFVIMGVLLFGKRAVPVFVAAALASLWTVAFAHRRFLTYADVGDVGRSWAPSALLTISLVLVGTGVVIWVIMDNTDRHLARIKRSEEEIRQAYDLTLEGWATVLEYRDESTEGHSRRVAEMSERLARAMGLSEEEVLQVRRGALLHDIGKLAVPDAILRKRGPLDPEERAVMSQHPAIARQLLAQVPFLGPSISIPYSHHERWDGQGYPDGLAGEQIPLPARIFAVVDQWEALCADRPYRAGLPREEVLEYLRENAGTIFDPKVVQAFLPLV